MFARIAVRSDGTLILGINRGVLAPGHVYEIIAPMTAPGDPANTSDMIIHDLGVSIATYRTNMPRNNKDPLWAQSNASWNSDANTIVCDGEHLYTVEEIGLRAVALGADPLDILMRLEDARKNA